MKSGIKCGLKRMKATACLALMGGLAGLGSNVHGQAAPDILFTNHYVTFTNLTGDTFHGAELIEADSSQVVFKTNGIFGTVKFTNVSPDTLRMIGVPDSHLEAARAAAASRTRQAAEEWTIIQNEKQRLWDPANLFVVAVESIQLRDNDPIYGQLQFCKIELTNGVTTTAFLARLPGTIQAFFDKRSALGLEIVRLTAAVNDVSAQGAMTADQIKQAQHQVDYANANPPTGLYTGTASDITVYNALQANQNQVNAAQQNINAATAGLGRTQEQITAWRGQIDQDQADLERMSSNAPPETQVHVLLSRYRHNGFQIMVCAPPEVTATAGDASK